MRDASKGSQVKVQEGYVRVGDGEEGQPKLTGTSKLQKEGPKCILE